MVGHGLSGGVGSNETGEEPIKEVELYALSLAKLVTGLVVGNGRGSDDATGEVLIIVVESCALSLTAAELVDVGHGVNEALEEGIRGVEVLLAVSVELVATVLEKRVDVIVVLINSSSSSPSSPSSQSAAEVTAASAAVSAVTAVGEGP